MKKKTKIYIIRILIIALLIILLRTVLKTTEHFSGYAGCKDIVAIGCGKVGDIPISMHLGKPGWLTLWRPSTGMWYFTGILNNDADCNIDKTGKDKYGYRIQMGQNGDVPFYTGDTMVVWRPSNGNWYVKAKYEDGEGTIIFKSGQQGDIPLFNLPRAGTVWRPSNGNWYFPGTVNYQSGSINVSNTPPPIQWGSNGDVPILDKAGDGNPLLIIWRPSDGNWYFKGPLKPDYTINPAAINWPAYEWGLRGDVPFYSNIYGDGKRLIVWRPSNGTWYINGVVNSNGTIGTDKHGIKFGKNGDVPMIYNVLGDGERLILWRPSTGTWYIKCIGSGEDPASTANI